MPEGHSVHRLARAFSKCFAGKQVDASSPQGRFGAGAALLDGRVLLAAEAHGKQMFLGFSGDIWLRVHLGLYGMWRFQGAGLEGIGRRRDPLTEDAEFPLAPRGLVRLRLVAGRHVADLSGPTACEVFSTAEKHALTIRMGEDPLRPDADSARAYAKLHASRSAIGLLLMRQDIVAGIGNIYRAEILFRARIEPHRPGRELAVDMWRAIWIDLVALMEYGVHTGRIVTTEPRDRFRGSGPARAEDASYVAHRAGKPCRVCGNAVLAEAMAGRTLYWCEHCQIL